MAYFPDLLQMWGRCSPSIRHLELFCFQPATLPVEPLTLSCSPHIALQSLHLLSLNCINEWLMHDLCPLDITRLKVLSLAHVYDEVLLWPKFAPALRTIEVLNLSFVHYSDVIDLSALPSLSIIRLSVSQSDSSWKLALDTLSAIAGPNCIRKIVFHPSFMDHTFSRRLDSTLESLPITPPFALELEMDSITGGQATPLLTSDVLEEHGPRRCACARLVQEPSGAVICMLLLGLDIIDATQYIWGISNIK
ncbi:hypothetical protein FB451DRAFT_1360155, partial [Mycena latifolia]